MVFPARGVWEYEGFILLRGVGAEAGDGGGAEGKVSKKDGG